MKLTYADTKDLIDLVLSRPIEEVRQILYNALIAKNWNEPQFYAGVIEHGRGMPFTGDQWADFLAKIPNRFLRDDSGLLDKLSERQRDELPPATFSSESTNPPESTKKE